MKKLMPEAYEERFLDKAQKSISIRLTEPKDLRLPERAARSHKYTVGRAVVVAGAEGYSGAPVLAANACERSGAGLTQLLVPRSIYPIAAIKCDGTVVTPIEADQSGAFARSAVRTVMEHVKKADACLVGPGIGLGDGARAIVAQILRDAACPVILDADAITIASAHPWLLEKSRAPLVLTPHEGEFKRIGGSLENGRLAGAAAFARAYDPVTLVLKGFGTLVCRAQEISVNPTGSAALAKGGSGDVLSGLLCALLAQGLDPLQSAQTAAYLHGLAGDLAAEALGMYSVTPSDVIRYLPEAFKTVPQK